jgi:hypothetical protein
MWRKSLLAYSLTNTLAYLSFGAGQEWKKEKTVFCLTTWGIMQPIAGVNVDTRKWWCCHFPDCIQPPSKKENDFKLSFGSRDLRPSNGDQADLDSDFYNF